MRPSIEYRSCCRSYHYRSPLHRFEHGAITSLTVRECGSPRARRFTCDDCGLTRMFRDAQSRATWLRRARGEGPNVHDAARAQ